MSETISQLPTGSVGYLTDVIPLTQGSTGPGTGVSRKLTSAKVLSSGGFVYAADPAYGVLANGSTDDTAGWSAALTAAQSTGAVVIAPFGVSVVSSISIPPNVAIIGHSTEAYYIGGSQGSVSIGSVIKGTSTINPIITMGAYSQLESIQIVGNTSVACINVSAGYATIFDVGASSGLTGIDGASTGIYNNITNCTIHENTNGIANVLSSRIRGCSINYNTSNGIILSGGCNQNVIVGNRFAWNGTNNIQIVGTSSTFVVGNAIVGNTMEASGGAGISLTYAHCSSVNSNVLGQSARNQSPTAGSAADTSFYLSNCTGVIINGNSSWVGNAGVSAYAGPYYAVYDAGSNTSCLISSNILTYHNNASSSVAGPINVTTTFNLAASQNVTYWASTA